MTLAKAKKDVEDAERESRLAQAALDDAEDRLADAEKRLEALRKVYEAELGAAPGTAEAARREEEHQRDLARARELYETAGKPLPAWLRGIIPG